MKLSRQQRRKLERENAKKTKNQPDLASDPIEKMAELFTRAEDPNDTGVPNIVMTDLFSEDGESEEMTATEFAKKLDDKS